MVVKYAERSATLALCPTAPLLATGTVAGAFDLSFSTTSKLELFELDFASPHAELQLAGGAILAPERFNTVAWGTFGNDGLYPYGLLAGGLVDGSIRLWDPAKVVGTPVDAEDVPTASIAHMHKHTAGVRGLQFNAQSPNLLASGGAEGELCIWDISNPAQPSLYPAMKSGAGAAGPEITNLAWNNKVQHILASCTVAGTVVVWDLKKQRPVISFRDNASKRRCSSLAWNPEVATQLVVASDDDGTPSLQLWDLRNSMAPVKELHGHTKGVLSLSWCTFDSALLLSSGKDNRTLCWDVNSGEVLADIGSSNWNFEVAWSLRTPGLFATAGFDSRVGVSSITSCTTQGTVESFNADFSVTQVPAGAATPLKRAPAWLKRPAAAAFGFGGKLATLSNVKRQMPSGAVVDTGVIGIQQVVTDNELVERSLAFERAIRPSPTAEVDRGLLRSLCAAKAEGAGGGEESETWQFMEILFEDDARRQLLHHLGFDDALPPPEPAAVPTADAAAAAAALGKVALDGAAAAPPALPDGDGTDFFAQEHEHEPDGFFNSLPTPPETPKMHSPAKAGAAAAPDAAPPATPGEGEAAIERALFVGNYAAAVDECLKAGRMADALLVASIGGEELWRKAQAACMHREPRPYMAVVQAVLENNLAALIASRPLESWRETLAILVTYASSSEWQGLCDTLGARLAAAGASHAATLCYICAGNVDAAVQHWTAAVHGGMGGVDTLQGLMEKAVVLGVASGQRKASPALSDLVDQYVGLLASQGQMAMAWDYLDMVPGEACTSTAILKDRLYRCGASDIPPTAKAPHFPFEAEEVATASASGSAYAAYTGTTAAAQPAAQQHGYNQPAAQQHGYNQPGYGQYNAPSYNAPAASQQYAGYAQQQPPAATYAPQAAAAAPAAPAYDAYGGNGTYGGTAAYGAAPAAAPYMPAAPTPPPALGPAAPAVPEPPTAMTTPAFKPAQAPEPPKVFAPAPAAAPPTGMPAPAAAPPTGMPAPPQPAAPPSRGPAPAAFAPAHSAGSGGFAPTPGPSPQVPAQQPGVFMPAAGAAAPAAAPAAPAAAAPKPAAPPAPSGPPANVSIATVDTSNVPPEHRGLVDSLTSLYNTVAPSATGAKKREMDDNSKRLGQLFWRINAGEVTPGVVTKLQQLCMSLDAGDYAGASHAQINLTTNDWSECSTWLTALKRLMKARQAMG